MKHYALALAVAFLAFAAQAQAQTAVRCFVYTIDNSDNAQGPVNQTNNDIQALVVGQYYVQPAPPPAPQPDFFDWWALGIGGTPITPLEPTTVWVGINTQVNASVRNAINQQVALYRSIYFGNVTFTRTDMLELIRRILTRDTGCLYWWTVKPGDNLTVTGPADLLSKFTAIPLTPLPGCTLSGC